MSRDLFVYHLCIDLCEKESNEREDYCWKSSILWKKARDKYSWDIIKWSLFMTWHIWDCDAWNMVIIHNYNTRQRNEDMRMEFIVGGQSLTQHGKGKWWRNQPRWLVRGTKQALVEWRLTICANC